MEKMKVIYTRMPKVEKIETFEEHEVTTESKISEPENSLIEVDVDALVNENKLNENCGKMNIKINKDDFRSMFGPKSKPRKGDFISISNKKFKVKNSKKYTAKSGKGFKVSLKKA